MRDRLGKGEEATFTVSEAAKLLRVGRNQAYAALASG